MSQTHIDYHDNFVGVRQHKLLKPKTRTLPYNGLFDKHQNLFTNVKQVVLKHHFVFFSSLFIIILAKILFPTCLDCLVRQRLIVRINLSGSCYLTLFGARIRRNRRNISSKGSLGWCRLTRENQLGNGCKEHDNFILLEWIFYSTYGGSRAGSSLSYTLLSSINMILVRGILSFPICTFLYPFTITIFIMINGNMKC